MVRLRITAVLRFALFVNPNPGYPLFRNLFYGEREFLVFHGFAFFGYFPHVIEDKATQEWMETFYRALLNKGKRTAESAQEASLDVLQRRREKRESTHPFYWAGFVASGDWR